jgi:glycosyltransferase involved in cell wall biosynthesis
VDLLRAAVARLSTDGFTLVITASPPAEPTVAWEEWIGTTSDERGMELLGTCDIVALPSSAGGEGKAQLPMKLIDAMLAARAVAVSDLGPMRWALGDCGLLFDPDSVDSLVHALGRLRDPHLRQLLGEKARERALGMFTPALLAATLDAALSEAILATERRS